MSYRHLAIQDSGVTDQVIVELAERIFADLADAQTINGAANTDWQAPLWSALSEAGLPLAWVPEDLGGAGAGPADGFGVASAAGRFAIAVPLVETMLAGWLLSRAGLASPDGAMTVAPARPQDRITLDSDGTLSGRARGVPFASDVQHMAVIAEGADGFTVALVPAAACRIERGENLAGDAADTVTFDKAQPAAVKAARLDLTPAALMQMGATLRSLQIAGALETLLDLSVRYANERIAFEKPIAKFQAVQHNLAKLAGEVAAAVTAAGSAADALTNGAPKDAVLLEVAAAKIRCAEAAEKGAAIAHQVHGAIGFSREHILHRYALRALGWRDDFGVESYWAAELGRLVSARGADELWPLVASR